MTCPKSFVLTFPSPGLKSPIDVADKSTHGAVRIAPTSASDGCGHQVRRGYVQEAPKPAANDAHGLDYPTI
jgi:hypothetical protein